MNDEANQGPTDETASETETGTNEQTNESGNEGEAPQSEIQMLRERCKLMGIPYSNASKEETLREKIAAKLAGEQEPTPETPVAPELTPTPKLNPLAGDQAGEPAAAELSERELIRREAMKLVRIRVTNMNPAKGNIPGEVICVANRVLGTVKKYVPFGEATEDGYHVPNVIYEELVSRKFLNIRTVKDRRTGIDRVESGWVREFAIDVLPQLTQEELGRLATAQAAAGSVD